MNTPCACGCGNDPKPGNSFLKGHNNRGKRLPNWKGGRIFRDGYWVVFVGRGHRLADRRGYAREHRVVWEASNNRALQPREHVHHIDGNRSNNDPANLVAMSQSEHMKEHCKDRAILSERRRREWADPEIRERRLAAMAASRARQSPARN